MTERTAELVDIGKKIWLGTFLLTFGSIVLVVGYMRFIEGSISTAFAKLMIVVAYIVAVEYSAVGAVLIPLAVWWIDRYKRQNGKNKGQ